MKLSNAINIDVKLFLLQYPVFPIVINLLDRLAQTPSSGPLPASTIQSSGSISQRHYACDQHKPNGVYSRSCPGRAPTDLRSNSPILPVSCPRSSFQTSTKWKVPLPLSKLRLALQPCGGILCRAWKGMNLPSGRCRR